MKFLVFQAIVLTVAVRVLCLSAPVSIHSLEAVQTGKSILIQLRAYDADSPNIKYYINNLPKFGSLFTVSECGKQKIGTLISNTTSLVTGKYNQVFYTPASNFLDQSSDSFTFFSTVDSQSSISNEAIVTIVQQNGIIVGSNFLLSDEGWLIEGNKELVESVIYEKYTRDRYLNRYIIGKDNNINVKSFSDESLFYFKAPKKFLGNQGITYGGVFKFTIGFLSGDFLKLNSAKSALVELYCETCSGPYQQKGIRLFYPLSSLKLNTLSLGKSIQFALQLNVGAGWFKDPQDLLKSNIAASKCDFLQVLSRLSDVRILGDFLYSGETVALDDVALVNLKPEIPLCAMSKSDASICTC